MFCELTKIITFAGRRHADKTVVTEGPDVSLYHNSRKSVVQRPPPEGVIWPFPDRKGIGGSVVATLKA